MYQLPIAATTKPPNVSGLRQYKWLLLQFWGSRALSQLCKNKMKLLAGWVVSGGSRRRSILRLLQLLEAARIPRLVATSLPPAAIITFPPPPLIFLPLSHKDLCDDSDNEGQSPLIAKSLISSHRQRPFCNQVTIHRCRG